MNTKSQAHQAYQKANALVKAMPDEQLLATWNAILGGSLDDSNEVNGIHVTDWIELVYSEVYATRGLKAKCK